MNFRVVTSFSDRTGISVCNQQAQVLRANGVFPHRHFRTAMVPFLAMIQSHSMNFESILATLPVEANKAKPKRIGETKKIPRMRPVSAWNGDAPSRRKTRLTARRTRRRLSLSLYLSSQTTSKVCVPEEPICTVRTSASLSLFIFFFFKRNKMYSRYREDKEMLGLTYRHCNAPTVHCRLLFFSKLVSDWIDIRN